MAVRVKVVGVNIAVQYLETYSKSVQNSLIKEFRGWAEKTLANAQRDVPVKTGDLKKTIRSTPGQNGLSWIVRAGGTNNVDYAPYVEFGTGTGVNQKFLQQFNLVQYASQFRGRKAPIYSLPARSFLYRNARVEFEKTLGNIKKILQQK